MVIGQGKGHSDPKMVSDTLPSQDAPTHTHFVIITTSNDNGDMPPTRLFEKKTEVRGQGQGNSDPNIVRDTLSS